MSKLKSFHSLCMVLLVLCLCSAQIPGHGTITGQHRPDHGYCDRRSRSSNREGDRYRQQHADRAFAIIDLQ